MASTPIRVVVAEHQPLIRRALVGLFENTPGLRIEAVAANGHSALAEIAALLPDVAVIDVRLPKHHDLSLLRAIRARGLRSRVVLLTTRPATDRPSLTGGIAASVSIADDEEKITATVVAAGLDISPQPAETDPVSCPLSARELQILQLAAAGRTGNAIAADLNLSPATVRTYMHRTYDKLAAHGRAAAVAHALRRGWIT